MASPKAHAVCINAMTRSSIYMYILHSIYANVIVSNVQTQLRMRSGVGSERAGEWVLVQMTRMGPNGRTQTVKTPVRIAPRA